MPLLGRIFWSIVFALAALFMVTGMVVMPDTILYLIIRWSLSFYG